MKSFFACVVIGVLLTSSFASCSKCYTCNFNGDVREICTKDLPDKNDGLKLTIKAYEAQGYTCTQN